MGRPIDEERLSDIHFQLANEDRRKIVENLMTESLKLNEVAKKLDISATEAFRQLQRLTDASLLEKLPDGRYRSTRYAGLILESSTSLAFLTKFREHFMDHDVSLIPIEFRARFGELIRMVLETETVPNLNKGTEAFKKADKRIDLMVEQRLEQHGQVIRQRALDGVKVRYLMQESLYDSLRDELKGPDRLGEVRTVLKICGMVILLDESVAISFPRIDGKMDYQLFIGNDPDSVKWAEDLFQHYWDLATPR